MILLIYSLLRIAFVYPSVYSFNIQDITYSVFNKLVYISSDIYTRYIQYSRNIKYNNNIMKFERGYILFQTSIEWVGRSNGSYISVIPNLFSS